MILISCVDNALGLRFNHRRQSRDRALCQRLLERAGGRLWLQEESRDLFPEGDIRVVERPEQVPEGGYCFWEEPVPETLEVEKILLYHWNRDYPADAFFVFPGGEDAWVRAGGADFAGSSHPEITEEIFTKKE